VSEGMIDYRPTIFKSVGPVSSSADSVTEYHLWALIASQATSCDTRHVTGNRHRACAPLGSLSSEVSASFVSFSSAADIAEF